MHNPSYYYMKVLFIGDSNSRGAGGIYATMTATTKALLAKGVDVALLAFNDAFSKEDSIAYGDVPQLCYHPVGIPILSTLGYSRDIHQFIEDYKPDIIHSQGLWMYHSAAVLRYKKRHPEVKVIVQPHGMLDPWAVRNSGWKKRIVGYWYEYENLRGADCIHALCQSEADAIREFGLKNQIAIIPNGIDIPNSSLDEILAKRQNANGRKTLLYIGRIHPKKGLRELIEGLAIIQTIKPEFLNEWQIKIAGWDQLNHTAELKNLISTKELEYCAELIGPAFGKEKDRLLSEASAYILPSFCEGLPMSVLEAWSFAIPVVMTPECNIPEGFSAEAALRCEPNAESIANRLTKLFSMTDEERMKIGLNGRGLVEQTFSWPHIADETIRLYNSLLSK